MVNLMYLFKWSLVTIENKMLSQLKGLTKLNIDNNYKVASESLVSSDNINIIIQSSAYSSPLIFGSTESPPHLIFAMTNVS